MQYIYGKNKNPFPIFITGDKGKKLFPSGPNLHECISSRVSKLIQDLTMSQSSRPSSFFQRASSRVKGLFKESFIDDTKYFRL